MVNIETLNDSNAKEFWKQLKKLGPKNLNKIPIEIVAPNGEIITDVPKVLKKLNRNIKYDKESLVVARACNGKAVGIDGLPYEAFKNSSCIKYLCQLFQLCFDTGKTPLCWNDAIIVPIPKSKTSDPRFPLNYRGISLLCTGAKLYTSLLNKRLVDYLKKYSLYADEQNGFRANRSCLDHVFSLTTIVKTDFLKIRILLFAS